MLQPWVSLLLVLFPMSASSASFDCAKASTSVEKLLCSTPDLSTMDKRMGDAFRTVLESADPTEVKEVIARQRKWLAERDRCTSVNCLRKAYSSRLAAFNALDPLADGEVGCEEMKRYPEKIFIRSIDLGSGSLSPIDFDFQCKESLGALVFLKKLSEFTENIRNDTRECYGTSIYALWREHHFDLSFAGIAPELFEESVGVEGGADDMVLLRRWSRASGYNHRRYKEFVEEFEKSAPLLKAHYKAKFGMKGREASRIAQKALMLFTRRAVGNFSDSFDCDESRIVQMAYSSETSLEEFRRELVGVSYEEEYEALKAALYESTAPEFIYAMVDDFDDIGESGVVWEGAESALFAALDNRKYVGLLLDHGEPVDHPNGVGETPLYYAIDLNDRELVTLLLDRGANVNHRPIRNEGDAEEDGCANSLAFTGATPLMHAAAHSDSKMLALLLHRGARLNDQDLSGGSALDYADRGGKEENSRFLSEEGAKPGRKEP